jgi:hypothetical protein
MPCATAGAERRAAAARARLAAIIRMRIGTPWLERTASAAHDPRGERRRDFGRAFIVRWRRRSRSFALVRTSRRGSIAP